MRFPFFRYTNLKFTAIKFSSIYLYHTYAFIYVWMCVCVCVCVCVYVCVNLLNLDSYVYSTWKKCVCEKQQCFVFLNASLIKNHMYIKWILKLNLPVVNFQHKRTIQHWEQEYPIDRICWCTVEKMLYLLLKNSCLKGHVSSFNLVSL